MKRRKLSLVNKDKKLIGKIDVVSWDDKDRPMSFMLLTDEEDIKIETGRYRRKLMKLKEKEVEIEGKILQNLKGEKWIRIKKLKRKIATEKEDWNEYLPEYPIKLQWPFEEILYQYGEAS